MIFFMIVGIAYLLVEFWMIKCSRGKKMDENEEKYLITRQGGTMASIGKRTGVGNLLGTQVQGFLA